MGLLYQLEPSSVKVYNCFLKLYSEIHLHVLLLEYHQ